MIDKPCADCPDPVHVYTFDGKKYVAIEDFMPAIRQALKIVLRDHPDSLEIFENLTKVTLIDKFRDAP